MSREEIDIVLSESFLKHKEVNLQLNIVDEFGRLIESLSGYFLGEAYQDYFVFENQKIDWLDVRNVEIIDNSKWFQVDMFESSEKVKSSTEAITEPEIQIEKTVSFTNRFMKKVKAVNQNKVNQYALRELNAIQLYENEYIDQETFFNLITRAGQRTIAEEGIDRFKFYLEREAAYNYMYAALL